MLNRALALLFASCIASEMSAQSCSAATPPILVGSEWEQYVRVVQVAGGVALEPWTIRGMGPRQEANLTPTDSALPWANENTAFARPICALGVRAFWLSPRAEIIHNSGLPFTYNDG